MGKNRFPSMVEFKPPSPFSSSSLPPTGNCLPTCLVLVLYSDPFKSTERSRFFSKCEIRRRNNFLCSLCSYIHIDLLGGGGLSPWKAWNIIAWRGCSSPGEHQLCLQTIQETIPVISTSKQHKIDDLKDLCMRLRPFLH